MIRVATAFSRINDAATAARRACLDALSKANLKKCSHVFLFATARHRDHLPEILTTAEKTAETSNIVGASGFGVLTEEAEIENGPGIAVMVLESDEIDCRPFLIPNLQENNYGAGREAGRILSETGGLDTSMFVFPDPFSFRSAQFYEGLESMREYTPVMGALASENGSEEKTYQWFGRQAAYDAMSGFALGGNVRTETGIARSCKPFGETLQITKASGNLIYEMDGRPAYDILLESISSIFFDNPDNIFQRIFLGIPVREFQTDFQKTDYLVRNILGVNVKNGMLACVSPVEEGDFVTFALRNPVFAREDMRFLLENLQYRISPSKPAFGFYFNCCARGQSLYGKPDVDTALIREYFPGLPVVGFFSYGELAPMDFVNHTHHYAGALTLVHSKS